MSRKGSKVSRKEKTLADGAKIARPSTGSVEEDPDADADADADADDGDSAKLAKNVPETVPFVESDYRETTMTYGDSQGVPKYVMAVWMTAVVSLAWYLVTYVVPDLIGW